MLRGFYELETQEIYKISKTSTTTKSQKQVHTEKTKKLPQTEINLKNEHYY